MFKVNFGKKTQKTIMCYSLERQEYVIWTMLYSISIEIKMLSYNEFMLQLHIDFVTLFLTMVYLAFLHLLWSAATSFFRNCMLCLIFDGA
jgi:hypothetical protein